MAPSNAFTQLAGVQYPVICGPMYPCSNPELVAAVSEAGGLGVVQPLSLTYVYGYDLRAGLKYIRGLTKKPIGMNIIVEKSSKIYQDRMRQVVDVSLEEGIRFFITSLGNPRWVVEKAHAAGAVVFHDVTERKWALKAREEKVDGLICVNALAGGHAGGTTPEALLKELGDLGLPLVCAGGVGSEDAFVAMLKLGYLAVQMGTRFIATEECRASQPYKEAITHAKADDVILTERLTGVPVSVIKTPIVERLGTRAGILGRYLLQHRRTKHWMRVFYSLKSLRDFKRSMHRPTYDDYWQAGKSVAGIERVEKAGEVTRRFGEAAARLSPGKA